MSQQQGGLHGQTQQDELAALSCSLELPAEPEDTGLAGITCTEAPSSSSIRGGIRQSPSPLSPAPANGTAPRRSL